MFEIGSFSLDTLIAIVLGAFIGHALTVRQLNYKETRVAANNLKESFQYCLVELNKGANPEILASAYYDKHRDAALKYLAYLSGRKRKKLEQALNTYTEWRKKSSSIASEKPRPSIELVEIMSDLLKHT